jgi:hypothetical protein
MAARQESTIQHCVRVPDTHLEDMRVGRPGIAPRSSSMSACLGSRAHQHTQGRNNAMNQPTAHIERSASKPEQVKASTAFTFQRYAFAACIILAPLSITLYLVTWAGNQRAPLTPLVTSAMAGRIFGSFPPNVVNQLLHFFFRLCLMSAASSCRMAS